MKEQNLNTDSTTANGKYRINARLKNKSNEVSDDAADTSSVYDTTLATAKDSANEFLSMASENAKKAYDFANKYKYQIAGAAGLIGAGIVLWSKRSSVRSLLPVSGKAQKVVKKMKAKSKK